MIDMKKNTFKWLISLLFLMMFCGNPVTLIIFLSYFAWSCLRMIP